MDFNYHDYFIKDGHHLGRYEDMYQNCADPWRIEELGPRLDMRAALMLLEGRESQINNFLDVGAGLGLFTDFLTQRIWAINPGAKGVVTDISATAVERAALRLADPRLRFQALDARTLKAGTWGTESRFEPQSFDLVVLAQVLWGLLEALPDTLAAFFQLLKPGGMMLISQHFPGINHQTYGADVVATPEDLTEFLTAAHLGLEATVETNRRTNHHWAALALRSP